MANARFDDPGDRADLALEELLRQAELVFASEDRSVERRPGYDSDETIAAAVALAGAAVALDGLMTTGHSLPRRWKAVAP
jgi:hypothetical protein